MLSSFDDFYVLMVDKYAPFVLYFEASSSMNTRERSSCEQA